MTNSKMLNICNWQQVNKGRHYDEAPSYFCATHEVGPFFYSHPPMCGHTDLIEDGGKEQCQSHLKSFSFDNDYRCTLPNNGHYYHERRKPSGYVIATWGSIHERR